MLLGKAVAHLFSSVSTGNDGADRVRKEREVPVICFSRVWAGNEGGLLLEKGSASQMQTCRVPDLSSVVL